MAFIHNLSTTNATTTSLPFRLYSATSTTEKIINAVIYYVLVLIPGVFTAYVISYRKRNFVDVIMNFKCGYYADYPVGSHMITGGLIRERQEIRITELQRSQTSRNVGVWSR